MAIVELLIQVDTRDICIINVSEDCAWTEKMVVCSCRSINHVTEVAVAVHALLKDTTSEVAPGKVPVIERGKKDGWKIVDCGSVIVHIFTDESRAMYDIEGLWGKGELVPLPEKMIR